MGRIGIILLAAMVATPSPSISRPVVTVGVDGTALVLPEPSGNPMTLELLDDPLLLYARSSVPPDAFLRSLREAVERHPAIAGAVADREAAEAVRTQARASYYPRIDAQLSYNRSLARDFGSRSAVVESLQPTVRTDLTATADQLLFDFGATADRVSAAGQRIGAARAEVERTAAETTLRAVAASYDVVDYRLLAQLNTALVTRQARILADVRERVAAGIGAAADVARAQAVIADSEAQGTRYDRGLAQASSRYREVFGAEPPTSLSRTTPPRSRAASTDAAEALADTGPAVRIARLRETAATRDAHAVAADGLPRLSAGLSASRFDVFTGKDYDIRGSLSLRMSLSAGGRQRGLTAQADAQARSAGFLADRIVNEARRDARIAFADVAALQATAAALETNYIATRRSRDAYVEQFRVSHGTLIELLRAEQDYSAAAVGFLQLILELDVARYTLLARTGEILGATGVDLTVSSQ